MDIDEEIAKTDIRLLHVWAEESVDYQRRGRAKAEIERRRRDYEDGRDERRRTFENELFNAESERQARREKFEDRLARDQMAHAEKMSKLQMTHATTLAAQQDRTARRIAWATIFAAIAAGFSASGPVLEVARYFAGK
jgi:hypothetical protein